jgi:plastocyanin
MSVLPHLLAAADPSKVPFYVTGALLAAWAVTLAAIGLSRPEFPGSAERARGVMALSAVLVVATMATAVATASKPTKGEGREQPSGQTAPAQGSPPQGQVGGASGGGPPPATAGAAASATVQVAADPSGQIAYQQKSLSARAGRVTIQFTNQAPVPHDVTIAQGSRRIGGTRQITGSKTTATVTLTAGRYTFYCSVDAHRQAGMQGTLTVA